METSPPKRGLKYVLRASKSNINSQFHLKSRLQRNIRESEKNVIQNRKTGLVHIKGAFQPRLLWIESIIPNNTEFIQWNWVFFIRAYVFILNQRISYLWNLRESTISTLPNYTSVRFLEAACLYYDIIYISGMFNKLRESLYPANVTAGNRPLYYILQCTIETILPKLLARVDNYISHYVRIQTMASLTSYLNSHPHSFLVLTHHSTHTTSTGTSSGALSTLLNTIYTYTTFHNHKSQQRKQAQAEDDIFTILKESAVESVLRSFLHIQPNVKPIHFTSIAINTSLITLLQILIEKKELFDEFGVYKLYRIILKIQEYIYEIKKEWQIPEGERLVASTNIWHKAEIILQILNCAVFSHTIMKSTTSSSSSSNIASTTATTSNNTGSNTTPIVPIIRNRQSIELNPQNIEGIITPEERENWEKLAVPLRQRLLCCYKPTRRQKGTVFVALELNIQNM